MRSGHVHDGRRGRTGGTSFCSFTVSRIATQLARGVAGARRGGLSRRGARPARLFAGRAARSGGSFELRLRQAGGRRHRDRRRRGLRRQALPSGRPRLGRPGVVGRGGAHPERLASLTILSRPHPSRSAARSQKRRRSEAPLAPSSRVPRAGDRQAVAGGQCAPPARRPVRPGRARGGDRGASVRAGQSRGDRSRARLVSRQQGPGRPTSAPIKVPTLYIWGDADATVGPDAATARASS